MPNGGAVLVLVLLSAGEALAAPLAVLPLDDSTASARLVAAVRARLREDGREVQEPTQAREAWAPAAGNPGAEAEKRLNEALKLYENLEFAKAEKLLGEALKLCREAMLHGDPGALYLKILHYAAAAAFYNEDREAARNHYADAIAYTPGKSPDASVFSPDVLAIFKKTRTASRKSPGKLKVVTRPEAKLELDGRAAGASPVEWPALGPGHHLLVIRRSGEPPQARWVVVPRGKTVTLSLDLPATGDPQAGLARMAAAELEAPEPGPATVGLMRTLGVKGLVLVGAGAGQGRLAWAEEGRWVKRYRGELAEGSERAFVDRALAVTAVVVQPVTPDCSKGPAPGCPTEPVRATPIYRRWWFWTIIAVAAGGAGVGIYFGVKSQRPQWNAEVLPREAE